MGEKRMKAVSYLRVSGVGQVEGDGFPRQRDVISRHARAQGVEVVGEFRDEGVSGSKESIDRPGLFDMLVRLKSNGVRLVLVERADRLSRDLLVGEVILDDMRRDGIRVVECEGGQDLTAGDRTNPTAKLIRQVLGVISEFDKDSIVLKLRASRERIRRQGLPCEGRKPYGFRPGEAAAVERIRELRRTRRHGKRLSCARIAEQLNAEGVPTRYGNPWKPGSVHRVLTRAKGR